MSKDSSQTRVAGTGSVYVASYGTALPSAWDTALPSAWSELGYTTEDGVTFTDEPSIERRKAWQSFYPVRILETARMAALEFELEQWNTATFNLAAGGATVAAAGTGSKISPHAAGTIAEFSVIVEIVDGTITDRYVIERAVVTSTLETKHVKDDLSVLPVKLEAIDPAGGDPWFILTSDATGFPA